ncbi:hypothetical protein [Kitasatospora camelliae]|uniref:Uncharacterized protein n=1 Tax=Kitasatospora camelliae TaxID=3156397 RepID=A0AAU8K5L0_9ACTN
MDILGHLQDAARAAERCDHRALDAALSHLTAATGHATDHLTERPADLLADADLPLVAYYAGALRSRLERSAHRNLYLLDEGTPQIDLFYLMAEHLPFMRAPRLANDALLPYLHGRSAATVLAFGIGHGRQEADLIERAEGLAEVTVYGVDVAPGSLDLARATLEGAGARRGVAVDFRGGRHGAAG